MKLINKKIVMQKDIGIHGNLFGGILMSWLDEAAAAYATEYCHTPNMVTIKVGELVFKKPMKSGQHLRIYGDVVDLGSSSVTLNLEARRYSLYNGEETVVCTTTFTFVRIDDDGTSTPIGETIQNKYRSQLRELEPAVA